MKFKFNPNEPKYKSITGGIKDDEKCDFFVETDAESCLLVINCDGQTALSYPMRKASGGFFASLQRLKKGLYWYRFIADGVIFGRDDNLNALEYSQNCFQLTVYRSDYTTPDYLKGGVIYQIFPDRFNKSGDFSVGKGKVKREDWGGVPTYRNSQGLVLNNEFFGGNFKGIEEKLDYLKSLNVCCIYLNPVNSAYSSHRYDTSDYLKFDEVLGDENDFLSLVNKANASGIRIVFDGVYNHVGSDSVYFNKNHNYGNGGAYNSKSSKYYDWFDFYEYPDKYASWWGFETLPSINKNCESFQEFITKKVIPHNLGLKMSGVRLDVADELTDEFIKNIRKAFKKNDKENLVLGEVWEDATNKIAYGARREYFLGEELDSVMNYPIRDAIVNYLLSGDLALFKRTVSEQINNYPKCSLDVLMNILSSHDSVRILTELSREEIIVDKDLMAFETIDEKRLEYGKKLLRLAYTILFTLYGVPSVYYGDETGMSGNLDPYNRKCFDWGNIDYGLLNFVKRLSGIRSKNQVFIDGDFNILHASDGVLIYERNANRRQIIVAINRNEHDYVVELSRKTVDLITEKTLNNKFTLKSFDSVILETISS
ncbi:MAG: glycoside hydrolase family 13 protein [Christensenellaceae bacterium]